MIGTSIRIKAILCCCWNPLNNEKSRLDSLLLRLLANSSKPSCPQSFCCKITSYCTGFPAQTFFLAADGLSRLAVGAKFIRTLFFQLLDVIDLIRELSFFYRCFYKTTPISGELPLMDFLFLVVNEIIHTFPFLPVPEIGKAEKNHLYLREFFPAFRSALLSEIFNHTIKLHTVKIISQNGQMKFYTKSETLLFSKCFHYTKFLIAGKEINRFNCVQIQKFIYLVTFPDRSSNSLAILSNAS